jgi:quercetin dioxygenase-like cupin family protein
MRPTDEQHAIQAWSCPDLLLEHYCYAPGPAEPLSKHVHDEYQLGLSLNWLGEYDYRGTHYRVPAGSLSVIHPGEMHAARVLESRCPSTA